jgi:hypothetical protein
LLEHALLVFERYYEIQDAVRMQVETRHLAVQIPDQILKPRTIILGESLAMSEGSSMHLAEAADLSGKGGNPC